MTQSKKSLKFIVVNCAICAVVTGLAGGIIGRWMPDVIASLLEKQSSYGHLALPGLLWGLALGCACALLVNLGTLSLGWLRTKPAVYGTLLAVLMLVATALPFSSERYKQGVRNAGGWSYKTTTTHKVLLFTPVGAVVFPLVCASYALLFMKRRKVALIPALLILALSILATASNLDSVRRAKVPRQNRHSDHFGRQPIASNERQAPPLATGAMAGTILSFWACVAAVKLKKPTNKDPE